MSDGRVNRDKRIKGILGTDFSEEKVLKKKGERSERKDSSYESKHPFENYVYNTTHHYGRRPLYEPGLPKARVEGGGTTSVTGKFQWSPEEFQYLVSFVDNCMDPALKVQLQEKVGDAGLQKVEMLLAKKISDFNSPERYSSVLEKAEFDKSGKKVS